MAFKNVKSTVINTAAFDKGYYRELFSAGEPKDGLRVYIKSGTRIYEAVLSGKAELEREEFCASKFTFTVVKDENISFFEGDAVSVKYGGELIFYGFVFSKERNKENLITTVAYDQLRYLKNKRTYTRGYMSLGEIVSKIADDNRMRKGDIARTSVRLMPMAVERISLLDVIAKAAADTLALGGGRFSLSDEAGYMTLRSESEMETDVYINAKLAEDFYYKDSIDDVTYNMVELYSDKPRYNLRTVTTVSDPATMKKWGTLILSKKAEVPEAALSEARGLLKKYNRVQRTILLKSAAGRSVLRGGSIVYVSAEMGDLGLEGRMRVTKAVHRFENNVYLTDLYLDGSEL